MTIATTEIPRDRVVQLLKEKTGLDDVRVKDMEIGIFNSVIEICGEKRISRNWANPKFVRLYMEKARSVATNIDKDSYVNNDELLKRVKENEFAPHELAFMKPGNVYPQKWREVSDNLMRKLDTAYEMTNLVTTTFFKCGKCKKNECTFAEFATRSADEPMTVFIRCIHCGNSWRQ